MVSANQVALDEGRIDYNQFESMAAHKFTCHGNWEDLDIEVDYTKYDIIKVYPVLSFDTYNDREVVSPKGFVKYMMEKLGVDDYDLDEVYDDYASLVYHGLGWTWVNDNDFYDDKVNQMIYYTFGACFGGEELPLAKYCVDYHQMWE